jgi:hypothetical protein
MKIRPSPLAYLTLLLLAACGSDTLTAVTAEPDADASEGSDAASIADTVEPPDTAAEGSDATPDDGSDATPDDGSDATPDDGSDATASDGSGDPDTAPPPDAGTDCSSGTSCESPYQCIDGLCRFPIGNLTFADDRFTLAEPAQLSRLFNLLRTFAPDLAFFVIATDAASASPQGARYGVADIRSEATLPIEVAWQNPTALEPLRFRPVPEPDAPLAGWQWDSEPFTYRLDTTATLTLPGRPPEAYRFGFNALQVVAAFRPFGPDGPPSMTLRGLVSRAETESRILGADASFAPLRALLCSQPTFESPSGEWRLADILDCNNTPLNADIDGDGTLDGYNLLVEVRLRPATIVP